jgi:hypothetical protein
MEKDGCSWAVYHTRERPMVFIRSTTEFLTGLTGLTGLPHFPLSRKEWHFAAGPNN